MIQLQQVTFRNFLSSGDYDTTIELTKCNLTLLSGENGQGKSIAVDAITYALFGKSYRGVNKPDLINNRSGRGMLVSITFSTGSDLYRIVRGMKPNLFEIYQNDELYNKDSARDYQKIIEEKVLGFDFKAYSQIVVLGTSSFVPFMRMPAAQRREFVESMLDVNAFAIMNKMVKADVANWKAEVIESGNQIDKTKIRIEAQNHLIRTLNKGIDERIDEMRAELVEIKREAKAYLQRKADVEAEIAQSPAADVLEIAAMEASNDALQSKIRDWTSQRKFIKKRMEYLTTHAECESCGQSIGFDHTATENQKHQSTLTSTEESLETGTAEFNETEKKIRELKKQNDTRRVKLDVLVGIVKRIKELSEKATTILGKIDQLRESSDGGSDTADALSALNELERQLSDQKFELNQVLDMKDVYEVAARVLKDGGIKATIVRQYLPILNESLGQYLTDLGFKYTLMIDENFNETIYTTHQTDLKYWSLSMGERQRVDLAMMFAWRDVARKKNSTSCNLLFLDEILDTGLDTTGVEDLMNVLERHRDSNIFIVSHRQEFLSDYMNRTIIAKKVNGYTVYSEQRHA